MTNGIEYVTGFRLAVGRDRKTHYVCQSFMFLAFNKRSRTKARRNIAYRKGGSSSIIVLQLPPIPESKNPEALFDQGLRNSLVLRVYCLSFFLPFGFDFFAMKPLSSARSGASSSFTLSVLTLATMMWPISVLTSS